MSQLENPRYRVLGEAAFVGGVLYNRGAEIANYHGWPRSDLDATNDAARKIKAYWTRFQAQMFFPPSPLTAAHGFHLPAQLPSFGPPRKRSVSDPDGSELFTPPADAESTESMPLYRLAPFYRGMVKQIGHYTLKDGEAAFAYLAWPDRRFETANAAAEAVLEYFERHAAHPDRLSSPWCEFRQATYLPPLPERGRAVNAPQPLSPVFPIPTAPPSRVTNSVRR